MALSKAGTSRFFSFRMYKEGLAQLALPGVIMAGIFLAIAVLQGWSEILWWTQRSSASWTACTSDAWAPLMFYAWTAPFLFSILLFSFLNSRKKSDFYHAFPLKRESLFFSFAAAIYTWIIATIAVVMAVATALFMLAGAEPTTTMILNAFFSLATAALYAATLSMLAVTLTGTLFSNVAVLLMLLWTPPLLSHLFGEGVQSLVPGLPVGEATFFGLNLSITLFNPAFLDYGFSTMGITSAGIIADIVWTAFLVLLMLVVSAVLFTRRKSEVAGSSAPNKWLQASYRIVIALPPLLLVAHEIAFMGMTLHMGSSRGSDLVFSIATAVIVSLILMCVFELVSTRKWRNLLKIPLSFLMTLALTFIFVGFVWAVAVYEANFTPSPDEIAWVAIPNDVRSNNSHMRRIDGRDIKRADTGQRWEGDENLVKIWYEELRIGNESVNYVLSAALEELKTDFDGRIFQDGPSSSRHFWDDLYYWEDWDEPLSMVPPSSSSSGARSNESLIFEIRTTGGTTRRRVLSYAELESQQRNTGRVQVIIPNELGKAFERLNLR